MNELGRPTALIRRIDLSADGQRASGAPATSEAALFHAYRAVDTAVETRPCVCGGEVTADPYAPARGVQAHNFTSRHRGWRAAREQ